MKPIGSELAALTALTALTACADDATTLPSTWNTTHRAAIAVDIFTRPEGALVRPLQGVDGAPLARGAGLPDLRVSYWDRPGGSDEDDGVHVDVVRVGDECALGLDHLSPAAGGARADLDAAALDTLARHLASVEGVRGDGALLVLGTCDAAPDSDRWAATAAGVARWAIGDTTWDGAARPRGVVGVQLALEPFATAARAVRAAAPTLPIASPTLPLGDATLDAFLDARAADDAPLDVLAVTGRAETIVADVAELAADFARRGLELELAVIDLTIDPTVDGRFAPGTPLASAQLGASEMAARLGLQPWPVRWMFTAMAPWSPAPPATALDAAGWAPTPYFDRDGLATPAFVMRAPMRQVAGEQRVVATTDAGDALTVLATLDGGTLSIAIVRAAGDDGIASLDYTLDVPAFALPRFPSAEYRLAELDASNRGVPSFFFSDLGRVAVDPATGDVHLTKTLPVPGMHFIEIDQPTP